jgi:hypothetical protein
VNQRERVLKALQDAGLRGITQVDFLRFPTVDGGPPITRVAARVQELRDEGYEILSGTTRDRCAVYILKRQDVPVVVDAAAGSTLFDPVSLHRPLSPYDEDVAA